ncbi:pyridoxal-phosphate dependent enzyme [Bacteroides sp. 214]|nr:pyridoxal-phosphate dependent enzyme [Bacteroides sp. 214]
MGNTPLLELKSFEKHLSIDAHLIGKLEYFNPLGSMKDRIKRIKYETRYCSRKRLNSKSLLVLVFPLHFCLFPQNTTCSKTLLRGVFQPQILDASTLYT